MEDEEISIQLNNQQEVDKQKEKLANCANCKFGKLQV